MRLEFIIDTEGDESVHLQIRRQIGEAIDRGCLGPGTALPDLDGLRGDLESVVDDLRATYRNLAEAGHLVEEEGRFVLSRDAPESLSPDERDALLTFIQASVGKPQDS